MKGKKALKTLTILIVIGILAAVIVKNFIPIKIAENVQSIETKLLGDGNNSENEKPLSNAEYLMVLENWETTTNGKKRSYDTKTGRDTEKLNDDGSIWKDDNGNTKIVREPKYLFVDSSNTFRNLYCVQSGLSQGPKYYVYDFYDIRNNYADGNDQNNPKYIPANTDFKEYFFKTDGITREEDTFDHFTWILENMYLSEYMYTAEGDVLDEDDEPIMDENTINELVGKLCDRINEYYSKKYPGRTINSKNDYDNMLSEFSTMYGGDYDANSKELTVTFRDTITNTYSSTMKAKDNYFKVIQNYILLCYFNQKVVKGGERPLLIDEEGNLAYHITTMAKNDNTPKELGPKTIAFTTELLDYLQNGFEYYKDDLNKYNNIDRSKDLLNYGYVDSLKETKYNPANGYIGPFELVNPHGFDISVANVTYTNTDGTIEDLSYSIVGDKDLSQAGETKFYIKVREELDNSNAINVNFNIDYGYVPDVKLLMPVKSTEDEAAPQIMLNVTKKKETRTIPWSGIVTNEKPDIALKKYIYKVNDEVIEQKQGETCRLGNIDVSKIKTNGTADYFMNKTPYEVELGDKVTYAIRLFNEGNVDATATKIKDYLPNGLSFVRAYDEQGRELSVTNLDRQSIEITSQYGNIPAFDEQNDDENSFKSKSQIIFVECRVYGSYKYVYTNMAEISEYRVGNNIVYEDKDSQANNWDIRTRDRSNENWINYTNGKGLDSVSHNEFISFGAQNVDDDDFDKIKVKALDIALTKRIERDYTTNAVLKDHTYNVEKNKCNYQNSISSVRNGSQDTLTYMMNKEPAEVQSNQKLVSVITVYNEGPINGVVKEITDYLPDGLTFDLEATRNANSGKPISFDGSNGQNVKITLLGNDGNGVRLNALGDSVSSYEVKIVTSVDEGASGVLYNSAAITDYGYIDAYNEYHSTKSMGLDRDSWADNKRSFIRKYHQERYDKNSGNFSNIAKNDFQAEDDDDVDCVLVVNRIFDLALRKSIVEVKKKYDVIQRIDDEASKTVKYNERIPSINENSLLQLKENKTADYYHDKLKVYVEPDDIITYSIRVYNEGVESFDYAGKATEITDYLPQGLTFEGLASESIQDWTAEYISAENKVKLTYNGNKIIDPKSIENIANGDEQNQYQEVRIKCKVNGSRNLINTNLTNRAAITGHKVYMPENHSEVAGVNDRDSQPDALTNPSLDSWYDSTVKDVDTPDTYYPGEQDDDDFETVYFNAYTVTVEKYDQHDSKLTGTQFSVSKYKYSVLKSSQAATVEQQENIQAYSDGIRTNGTYKGTFYNNTSSMARDAYVIKEIQSTTGHSNPFVGKYIKATVVFSNGTKYYDVSIYNEGENQTDYISDSDRKIDKHDPIYEYVKYEARSGGLYIKIINPDTAVEGKYSVQLEKRGSVLENGKYVEGEKIAGVQFNASGTVDKNSISVQNPLISTGKDEENVYIIKDKEISRTDTDTFIIKETSVGTAESKCYLGLPSNASIKLIVEKEKKTSTGDDYVETTTYKVKSAKIVLEGISSSYLAEPVTDKRVVLKNGTIIRLDDSNLSNLKLVVSDPSKKEDGKYSLQLEKKSLKPENGVYSEDKKLKGVEFYARGTVDGVSVNSKKYTSTGEGEENPYIIRDMDIRKIDTDIFYIEETNIGSAGALNYYLGLPPTSAIKVYVEKECETVVSGDNTQTLTYKVRDAYMQITNLDDSFIAYRNNVEVRLTNGTIIRLDKSNLSNLKISVANPPVEEQGHYNVQLEKKTLRKENDSFVQGNKLPGVVFYATGKVEGNILDGREYTSTGEGAANPCIFDGEIRSTDTDMFTIKEIRFNQENNDYYLGLPSNASIQLTVKKRCTSITGNKNNQIDKYEIYDASIELTGLSLYDQPIISTPTKKVLKNGTIIELEQSNDLQSLKIVVSNPPIEEQGKYSLQLEKRKLKLQNHAYVEGEKYAGVKFEVNGTVEGAAIPEAHPVSNADENVKQYIIEDKEIRSTSDDTFTVKEIEIDPNSEYYLGLPEGAAINITVEKQSEIQTNNQFNIQTRVYSVKSASISLSGVAANQIKSSTPTKIVLKNGTIIRLDTQDLQNLKLVVSNPVKDSRGSYSVQLEKRGLIENSDGTFTIGRKLPGVIFDATGTVDGVNADIPSQIAATGYDSQDQEIENVFVIEDRPIRTTEEDTFRFIERSMGTDSESKKHIIGTDGTIVLKVQKTMEQVNERNQVVKVYKATGATIALENVPASDIKTQTPTEIVLNNGTTIRATFDADSGLVKLMVADPKQDLTGRYRVTLEKFDLSTQHYAPGFKFKINNVEKITSGGFGTIDVSDGVKTIDKNNVETVDQYVIEEQENSGYHRINHPITLRIYKGPNSSETEYVITKVNVGFWPNNQAGISVDINVANGETNKTINVMTTDGPIAVKINVASNGTITVTANNDKKEGDYELEIYKSYTDQNGQSALGGASFSVSGYDSNLLTDSTEGNHKGYTRRISKEIDNDNWQTTDEFTITEISTGNTGIVGLKYPIKLYVTKQETTDGFEINTIQLENTHTGNRSAVVNGLGSAWATLENIEIDDATGRTVTVRAKGDHNKLITIEMNNLPRIDKINVKIKKVNAENDQPLPGVKFKSIRDNAEVTEATTGNDGEAYLDQNREVRSNNSEFTYVITEEEVPNQPANLLRLSDFGWILNVKTKYDSTLNKFVVDKNRTTIRVNATGYITQNPDQHNRQEEIAQTALETLEVSEDGSTVSFTVENETTTDYGFTVRKADSDTNTDLQNAVFTVYEDGNIVASGKTASELSTLFADKTGVVKNSTHTYEIYETYPEEGYENILEKVYIKLVIRVDRNGNATATYSIEKKDGATNDDLATARSKIEAYLNAHNLSFIETLGNNRFKLNIPNPKAEIPLEVNLKKFELGDLSKSVEGAIFGVRKLQSNYTFFNAIVGQFSSGTGVETLDSIITSRNNTEENIDEMVAIVGNTYYYEIKELNVPANFKSNFYGAIVKVTVNQDKSVSSSIFAVKDTTNSVWRAYSADYDGTDYISVNENGTPVTIKWANELFYNLCFEKLYFEEALPKNNNGKTEWLAMHQINGATFKVQQIAPTVGEVKNIAVTGGFVQEVQDPVQTNTQYIYKISETVVPNGCMDIFKDMEITLSIYIDANGKVSTASATVNPKEGATVADEDLEFARKCVIAEINADGKTAYLRVANQKKKNTFNLKLFKMADQRDSQGNPIPLSGVEFRTQGPATDFTNKTDGDGYISVNGIVPNGYTLRYYFRELSVPNGVIQLNGTVEVVVKTQGISSTDDPEVIEQKLKTQVDTDGDGVLEDRITVNYVGSDMPTGFGGFMIRGTDIIIPLQNESKKFDFGLVKTDEIGTPINSADGLPGAAFKVTYATDDDVVVDDVLNQGFVYDSRRCGANETFEYVIEEKAAKAGFVNVLEGYKLHVYLRTTSQGLVSDFVTPDNPNVENYSHYSLERISGVTPRYTEQEIYANDWLHFFVNRNTEDSSAQVYIENPYAYYLELNKLDANGSTPINKAKITAQRIGDVNSEGLYTNTSAGRQEILSSIVNSTDITETLILNRQETVKSDDFRIENNPGDAPRYGKSELWRIKEDKTYAPYINVLGDNTIVVETFYSNNQLRIAKHIGPNAEGIGEEYNFYVTDEDGNDVTYQYAKYIDAHTEKVNGEWKLSVSIKNPMALRFGVFKTKGNSQTDPLSGAHITVKLSPDEQDEQVAVIENGAYESEMLVKELPINGYAYATVTEESTAKGYINVLKGYELRYSFKNNGNKIKLSETNLINTTTGQRVTGAEKDNVMRYITLSEYTTEDGYQAFKVYIQNPLEFKFKLTKKDISGNNLDGTRISVYSTHSGPHTLSSGSELSFTETYVRPNEVITYTIEERNTVRNSAYVNSFVSHFFRVEVTLNEGIPTITKKEYVDSHSPSEGTEFDTFDGFNCYFDPSSVNDLEENELQTLTVEMENPVQYKVELNKWSAGDTPIHIANTKFTIEDQETHTEYTDENGQIDYTNIIKRPGLYNIIVRENETAGVKYVNVLKDKYMKLMVVVNADGTIGLPALPLFYNSNTGDQITGNEELLLRQYCSARVDSSDVIKKLVIDIKDPVTYDIKGIKVNTANGRLENARFKIISTNTSLGTVSENTDSNGQVSFTEDWIKPGIYEYRVQEEQTPGAQYENVLYPNYIKFFVKVDEDGRVGFVDKNGNIYPGNVASNNRYYVVDANGDEVDAETRANVRKYWRIYSVSSLGITDRVIFQAINPVQYKLDIAKKQYSNDGEHEDDLEGAKFTVIKNESETVLDRAIVTSAVELEEHLMEESNNTYDIYENEVSSQGAYVNILQDKHIRVYTHVDADGNVTILDNNGQRDDDYFEIYQHNHFGPATVIDRATNQKLYDSVAVSSVKGADGIYTLNVKVINPIEIKVEVLKKQVFGYPIPDVTLSVNSDISGVHIMTTRGTVNSFEENEIKPGRYDYDVREHFNPNHKYVNILEGRYARVNVSIDKTGAITVNNVKFFNNQGGAAITDAETLAMLNKYFKVSVNTSERVQKLRFDIENPVTLAAKVVKTDTEGNELEDASFTISRYAQDQDVVQKHKADAKTDANGEIVFEDGEIFDPGIYRYEVIENEPAADQYVNILKVDGVDYKIVAYVRIKADGTTEFVRDANGTRFGAGEDIKYFIERVVGNEEVPQDVIEKIQKYVHLECITENNQKDTIKFTVENPFKIDLDVTKVTKIDNQEQSLAHTEFAATMDNTVELFDKEVDQNIEHTVECIEPGEHTFNFTEVHGVQNGGFINVLEGRYVKVYTNIAGDGVLTIKDNNGNDDSHFFEIYEGEYNSGRAGTLLDRNTYAKIYECVSVEAVRQSNGVYKLNIKVNNPERNYKLTLNKRLLTRDIINLRNVEFKVKSGVTGRTHTLVTDKYGNFELEEKQVPVGVYEYLIKESKTAGPEFKNILKNNYVAIYVKVNQDGSIRIVDKNGYEITEDNSTFYVLDMDFNPVNWADTIVDENVAVSATNNEDEPRISLYMKNPEFYNLRLTKIDSETLRRLNGIAFSATVQGEDSNRLIDLYDADTYDVIDLSNLVTSTVDGEDGVISIENIRIEKSGTYTFTFHEKDRALNYDEEMFGRIYKTHGEDIVIEVDIGVEYDDEQIVKEYVVEDVRCIRGARYIDEDKLEITTDKPQTVNNEVLNTPIRGHYDLILNKLDKYTKAPLDGAEFNITVEKGEDRYQLYDDDASLDVKNIVIPRAESYVVQNGVLTVPNIRIERPETYRITLTETKAPAGYMLLDEPIVMEVNTVIDGEYDDARFIVNSISMVSGENHGLVYYNCEDNLVEITAENEYFDLALRKSITSVAYSDSDTAKITEEETKDRIPMVDSDDDVFDGLNETAAYKHVKNHVRGYAGQEVIYTLRVYNEGEIDGYAEEITDHLPEGLEFVNDSFNAQRGWILDYKDPTEKTVKTTFLSKDNNPGNERFNAENNLIKALNPITGELDYKEIEIKCRIKDNLRPKTILTNIAEISMSKAEGRSSETVDRDSTPNNADIPDSIDEMQQYKEDQLTDDRDTYVPGQEDDDDFEKVIIEEFDLALRKYITAVNEDELCEENTEEKYSDDKETNDGTNTEDENADNDVMIKYSREPRVNVSSLKERLNNNSIYLELDEPSTATYTHTKQPVEVSVGDIVTYTLEVFNEGTVSGYASLIKDDIPEGLEFVAYAKGDGSVNDIYGWKMVDENDVEVTDPKEAKFVISEYLSKDNEETERSNLIKAFDPDTMTGLDSKYVQVQFRVICKQDYPKIITNYAQISDDSDEDGKDVDDRDSTPNEWIDEEDDQDVDNVIVTYMDLALRKFITGVTDFKEDVTYAIDSRIPEVDPKALIDETGTTAEYKHTKDPVLVHTNDIVIYTLRIFNEGSKNAYATQIKDNIPEGLVFLPDHPINKEYEWEAVDENGKHVDVVNNAKYIVTNYLSKENETDERQNLLGAFDYYDYENDKQAKLETPEYKDVMIAFKVTEPQTSDRIIENDAQISEQTDGDGIHREDRDSTPDEWLGEDDEDIEKIRVQYFDLALRKWVTKAIVTQNGKTEVTETGHHAEDDPEEIVKVDIKKSKIDSVVVKFEYQIRITNEGEIAGYAKEIKDYIPQGLSFDPADNPTWTQISENVITTDDLKDTLLQPGESAEVTVVLTWINSGTNLGLKVNKAEISKDYNDYDTPDVDSTPDNDTWGEDDIDDAPVMLAVKTGNQVAICVAIITGIVAIIGLGVYYIKKTEK